MRHIESITPERYTGLIANARTIHRDRRGVQVLLRPDGRIVKLFYRRGGFSSDLVRPYAVRFAGNAARLRERGIHTVEVKQLCRCRDPRLDLVVYPMLPGKPVRGLLDEGKDGRLPERFMGYVADLHRRGILFKGLHPGNVLCEPPDRFSLIDIVNVKFTRGPLPPKRRAGNLHHLLSRREDQAAWAGYGFRRLLEDYLAAAGRDRPARRRLLRALIRRSSNQPALKESARSLLSG